MLFAAPAFSQMTIFFWPLTLPRKRRHGGHQAASLICDLPASPRPPAAGSVTDRHPMAAPVPALRP